MTGECGGESIDKVANGHTTGLGTLPSEVGVMFSGETSRACVFGAEEGLFGSLRGSRLLIRMPGSISRVRLRAPTSRPRRIQIG